MTYEPRASRYKGSYLIGFILIVVVAIRTILFFQGQTALTVIISLLSAYSLLYALEPLLSNRLRWYRFIYFPLQTVLAVAITTLRPFTDISNLVYIPIAIQALHAFSRPVAIPLMTLYAAMLNITLILGMGWAEGLALGLLYLAVCTFLISYDLLYSRSQADQAESLALLADLQAAHQKLREYADQAGELSVARERNRLARELHDSVSQVIFSITLTSQAARLLLERNPARVPEQLNSLQEMTSNALQQLRSLITQLRPQQKS